jgi:hypothetical protein
MKKILVLATAAFLFSGVAFAGGGDGKKCGKNDKCTKDCCSKKTTEKKDTKATAKTTAKKA